MDRPVTMKGKGPIAFRTRHSRGSRRMKWSSWLGCLVFVFTILEIFSYLSGRTELSLFRKLNAPYRPEILRPGQYRETVGHQYGVDNPDADQDLEDDMGVVHDRRDARFFLGGTLILTSPHPPNDTHPVPVVYDPYPEYNSKSWKRQWTGHFQSCLGPRGRNLDRSQADDMVLVYKGKQAGFPESRFGSYDAMGLDGDVCTDRYSRFGAYGYDEDSLEDVPGFQRPSPVSWSAVDWRELQSLCLERNTDRYRPGSAANYSNQPPLSFELGEPPRRARHSETASSPNGKQYHPRSAILVRAWHGVKWTSSHCEYLRSLIMELALHSGGEYEVFLLVHVKDDDLPIFSDAKTMDQLRMSIPEEFRNIAHFFNSKMLEAWYPKIAEHSPVLQHHQPLQIFSQLYPNFDYYWQLELDSRHTGHIYHFLEKAISFAKEQPRKYLWERNAYFYTPGAHGTWSQFMQMVDDSLADQSSNTVWGGPLYGTGVRPLGPEPPEWGPEKDNYTWGVGEEADLITFLPIFNPRDTEWTFPDKIWNFRDGTDTPRRAAVITMGRYSKRLLDLVHRAQATQGLGLASEMTGPSWALYHGLKAVSVPHPIYADGQWTPQELARIYNRGPPENMNGGPDSIWNFDHLWDHISYRLSYMFTTHTGEDLYRRWMGFRTAEHVGGRRSSEERYGRHCFPSIFLHTVKNTDYRIGREKAVP